MSAAMPDTSAEAIGRRLVAVRKARGWTQIALAGAVGATAQRWQRYEAGITRPPPDMLARFWQVTGATTDYVLLGRTDGLPLELARALQDPPSPDAAGVA